MSFKQFLPLLLILTSCNLFSSNKYIHDTSKVPTDKYFINKKNIVNNKTKISKSYDAKYSLYNLNSDHENLQVNHKAVVDKVKFNNRNIVDIITTKNNEIILLLDNARIIKLKINKNKLSKQIWSYKLPYKKIKDGYLSWINNKLYISSGDNIITSLDANTGAEIWRKKFNYIIKSRIKGDRHNIYFVDFKNNLYSFNVKHEHINWKLEKNIFVNNISYYKSSELQLYKKYIIVAYQNGLLLVVNKNNGKVHWETRLNSNNFQYMIKDIGNRPIIKNNKIFIANKTENYISALNLKGLEEIWKNKKITVGSLPWYSGKALYFLDYNYLYAINAENGKKIWYNRIYEEFKIKNTNKKKKVKVKIHPPLFVNNKIMLFSNLGEILYFNPNNGKKISRIELPIKNITDVTFVNGHMLVIKENKVIYLLSNK